jgi:hypothetical protein
MSENTEKEVVLVDSMGLVRELMQVKSAVPATIIAVTEEKMNKTNNPFYGRVTKRQRSNVFINFDYAKSVNKRLTKEGKDADFVAHKRTWGEHLPGTPIVFHNNMYYLEAGFLTKNDPKVEYFLDGEATDKAVFETFMKSKTETVGRQGLDAEVVLRDFKIDSIHEIHMNGKIYRRTDI